LPAHANSIDSSRWSAALLPVSSRHSSERCMSPIVYIRRFHFALFKPATRQLGMSSLRNRVLETWDEPGADAFGRPACVSAGTGIYGAISTRRKPLPDLWVAAFPITHCPGYRGPHAAIDA
jgi:hypothetical protein